MAPAPTALRKQRLIVIGGGAAGMFAAVNTARLAPDLEVIVLEKSAKWLSKVRVSGGGRCNVTHDCPEPSKLVKYYPRGTAWLKKSFSHFATLDTIQWFAERGVHLKVESDGRMFPTTDSSETIIRCLLDEASHYRVQLRSSLGVEAIQPQPNSGFQLQLSNQTVLTTDFLLIATGGGTKRSAFDFLQASLPHELVDPVPSLFTFNLPKHPITQFMGLSVRDVQVRLVGTKLESRGPVLITHWGLSGPAVLKLSAWAARYLFDCNYEHDVLLNWLPAYHEQSLDVYFLQQRDIQPNKKVANHHIAELPQRLWQYFLEDAQIHPDWRWADLPAKQRHHLARTITNGRVRLQGKTTFKEEFVTAGGIALTDVDPHRMESKHFPGLFFAGEVLDVDGVTGGFNFQHAWTSGYNAAAAITATYNGSSLV